MYADLTFFFISAFSFFLFIHTWEPGRCQDRLTSSWDGRVVVLPRFGTANILFRFLVPQTTYFFIAFEDILYRPTKQGASPGSIQADRSLIWRVISPRQSIQVFCCIMPRSPWGPILVLLPFQSFHEAGKWLHLGNTFFTSLSYTCFATWERFTQRS